jgi:phage-related minor tail protein
LDDDTLTASLTTTLSIAGGSMLKSTMDLQAAQGKLQASLGITAQEAEKLGRVARDVWEQGFGESIDEANQAVIMIRQTMGDLSNNEIKDIATGAMTVAQTFNQDVNEVITAASVMMKNFGISGTEALDINYSRFSKRRRFF